MERRISDAQWKIAEVLQAHKSPIIAYSGGKDSQLLLHLVREIDPSVPCLTFSDWFPLDHKRWVQSETKRLGLTVFSYRPSVLEYRGSIISHYPFGASQIPVITDVEHSDECGLDKGRKVLSRTPLSNFLWDVVFTGSRYSDSHKLVPKLDLSPFNVCTPLWSWDEPEVTEALNFLNIPTSKTSSDAKCCMRCLEPEGRMVFCPKKQRNIPSIGL